MNCNVCNQDKELNQFQTYWHSTQQKMRTRKQCTACLYEIKLKRKDPEKYYSNNPNYRKCVDCKEWKLLETEFYPKDTGHAKHRCRMCTLVKDRTSRKTLREQELSDGCGSEKVISEPNQYRDIYQKECTFFILNTLGYTYDEPTGIWTKEPWKTIKDGKAFFPDVHKTRKLGVKVTKELYAKIFELREFGWGYKRIGRELNLSGTTVFKYLNGYYGSEIN